MKKAVLAFCLGLAVRAQAAPLFPDTSPSWVKDSLGALSAHGLIEGYPDGCFKGDRSASRWEAAMLVARLLSLLERQQATFASHADIELTKRLAVELQSELEALGVRVTNLEANTSMLDQRVNELERITFYGSFEARVVNQSFRNTGVGDNDNLRRGAGAAGPVPFFDYNAAVGADGFLGTAGPQVTGVLNQGNWLNGKPLTNGTGFSSRANLGLNVKLSPELEGGIEFAAYTQAGNRLIDGYWGVQAPWLASPAVHDVVGPQTGNNLPYTKMVLDHFWLHHIPSGTHLTAGYLDHLDIDPLVYAGRPQIGTGPLFFPGFGLRLNGRSELDPDSAISWEAFASRVGQAQVYQNNQYLDVIFGADVAYEFGGGKGLLRFNATHLFEDTTGGEPLQTGINAFNNVPYGASGGWSVVQWVNPPGHFANQRSPLEIANTGANAQGVFLPNTYDTRPISGWNAANDNAAGINSGGGNYGPQAQDTYGGTARYRFDLDEENKLQVKGQYAHSDYTPNSHSSYRRGGNALGLELYADLLQSDLELTFRYISVDPTYAPTILLSPMFGLGLPVGMDFTRARLHDFINYPQNREGVFVNGQYYFDDKHGKIGLDGFWLDQKKTSLYDVRVLPGALGLNVPTGPVIGFSPGFSDVVFYGFAHPGIYGPGSQNSFAADLSPLENPRGSQHSLGLSGSYRWNEPAVTVELDLHTTNHHRPTSLSPALGGSQNFVDVTSHQLHLGTRWDPVPDWELQGGVDITQTRGHFDPAGLFNTYAVGIGSSTFDTLDATQTAPYLGATWHVNEKTSASLLGRYYFTSDHLPSSVFAGPGNTIGQSVHPFSWEGLQVISEFSVKF